MKTEKEKAVSVSAWRRSMQSMVDAALADGVVVTVHTVPRLPLAMGNYDVVVDARECRVMSEPINRDGVTRYYGPNED